MRTADLLFNYDLEMTGWLDPILLSVGFGIALWAFWRSRKWGYAVVALYFLLTLAMPLIVPHLARAVETSKARHLPEEVQRARKEITREIEQAAAKVYAEHGVRFSFAHSTIHVHLIETVLALGLWLIARQEPRKPTKPITT